MWLGKKRALNCFHNEITSKKDFGTVTNSSSTWFSRYTENPSKMNYTLINYPLQLIRYLFFNDSLLQIRTLLNIFYFDLDLVKCVARRFTRSHSKNLLALTVPRLCVTDMAPCNFVLILWLKFTLHAQCFESIDAIVENFSKDLRKRL